MTVQSLSTPPTAIDPRALSLAAARAGCGDERSSPIPDSAGEAGDPPRTVHVGSLAAAGARGGLLVVEAVLVPAVLLYLGLRLGGPVWGLGAVLVWRVGMPLGRVATGCRVPSTLVLSTGLFCVRTGLSMGFMSVYVYLWQPVIMSALMGLWFMGTALVGRPVMMRLAHDVVRLPEVLKDDARVRRVFAEVSVVWGGVHVLCALLGAATMRGGAGTVVLVHGALGVGCALASNAGAALWGWWRMHRLSGVIVRFEQADSPPIG